MSVIQAEKAMQIEKSVVLRASRSRVWRALTDSAEFGAWFGADFTGPFLAGAEARGKITTKGYEHLPIEVVIERMEPERLFSFRWPHNPEGGDLALAKWTLVVFELTTEDGGTRLSVTETGFEALPEQQRMSAVEGNSEGWAIQMTQIAAYLDGHP